MGGESIDEKRTFVEHNMDLESRIDYIVENHYYPAFGAFSRYEDKSKGN